MSRRRTSVAIAVLAVVLSALAPVQGALAAEDDPWEGVTWSAPEAVSPVGVDVDRGGVWQLSDGSMLALWSVYDHPAQAGDGPAQVWTSTRPAGGGAWTAPVAVSDFQQYFTAYPNFAWDVNEDGAAVVAWTQYDPDGSVWTYRAVTRSGAGAWTPPTTIATSRTGIVGEISSGGDKSVAVAPDGRASVVFTAREAARSPGENSQDMEVFRIAWSGSAWSAIEEISVETPLFPINCDAPDPDDCPDREGPSDQPVVAYDGLGQEWIAWVHQQAADEAAEEAGVFLHGPSTTQLAAGSTVDPRDFTLGGIAGDPGGGAALAWRRQTVAGIETWAHAGGDVSGATSRITAADTQGAIRSIAISGGHAVVVVGVLPSGIDGSRPLVTATRAPGTDSWNPSAAVVEDGGAVIGTGGRSVVTADGVPLVAYAVGTTDRARVLAPADSEWTGSPASGAMPLSGGGTLVHSFSLTPAGTLLGAWLSPDGGVDRLQFATSTGLPDAQPPLQPPPPTPALTSPAGGVSTTAAQPVAWTPVAGAVHDVRVRTARWNGSFGSPVIGWTGVAGSRVSHATAPGGTYCYSVRARNAAGASGWSGERCVTAPLDQTALAASKGWRTTKGSAYVGGSALSTKKKGARLTRTGARLQRVGVVATSCGKCGKVDVFVGSRKIGRINLKASGTHHKKVYLLPGFSPRSGTVKLKVVTRKRLVRIDALVIGAR